MSQNAGEKGAQFPSFRRIPGARLINRILPSSFLPPRPPPSPTRDIKARAISGGGEGGRRVVGRGWRPGTTSSRGGGGVVLDMIGCQTGVNPGLGHTPPRLNPPLERMAAGGARLRGARID